MKIKTKFNLKEKTNLNIIITSAIILSFVFIIIFLAFIKNDGNEENTIDSKKQTSVNIVDDELDKTTKEETTKEKTNKEEKATTDKEEITVKEESTKEESTKEESTKEEATKKKTTKEETPKEETPQNEEDQASDLPKKEEDNQNEDEVVFSHPGILHTEQSINIIKSQIDNKMEPVFSTYNVLKTASYSSPYPRDFWEFPRAVDTVIRGGTGDNVARLYIDVARAYHCALLYSLNGSLEHGNAAVKILNAWSSTLKTVTGNADRYLATGLFGYQLANASELVRNHKDFKLEQMQKMLLTVFYPMNERFLVGNEWGRDHNDAYISNYWANWDLSNMASVVAIGIFTDRKDIFDQGINYFKYGLGNGSIYNAIPFIHNDNTAQWQESGRDQGHSILGIGLMASICEMAWNQGTDLYGFANNRFLKAAEYVAKYNNGEDVEFSVYEWGTGQNGTIQHHFDVSFYGRGEIRPIWNMIYNHYVNRKKLSAPNVKKRLELHKYEYGAGGHATTFDQPGWGSLTYVNNIGYNNPQPIKGNIADGEYKIVSIYNGKVLATNNENQLVQQNKTNDEAQIFRLIHISGGEYKIVNKMNGKTIEVKDTIHDNGANLILSDYKGSVSQKFAFLENGSNNYRIIAALNGKAIDIKDWSKDDNAPIILWRYVLGDNQKWRLEKVID